MRLIIRNSLKVLLAALAIYVAVIFIFSNVQLIDRRMSLFFIPNLQRNGGQELKMMRDLTSNQTKYDAIVLGSSHAYRGYDPRIFEQVGINLFNMQSQFLSIGKKVDELSYFKSLLNDLRTKSNQTPYSERIAFQLDEQNEAHIES